MPTKTVDDSWKLSTEQLDLIESFEADFNAVEHFFEKALSLDNYVPFAQKVARYSERHPGWDDATLLKTIAKVRNVIVHSKSEPYRNLAIPTPELAQKLRACLTRFPPCQHSLDRFSTLN